MEDPDNPPEVWAHKKLTYELDRFFTAGPAGFKRAARQFGIMIPDQVNAGIGSSLRTAKSSIGILYPDHFLDGDEADVEIAGARILSFAAFSGR